MPFRGVGLVLNAIVNAGILACFKKLSYHRISHGSHHETKQVNGMALR